MSVPIFTKFGTKVMSLKAIPSVITTWRTSELL